LSILGTLDDSKPNLGDNNINSVPKSNIEPTAEETTPEIDGTPKKKRNKLDEIWRKFVEYLKDFFRKSENIDLLCLKIVFVGFIFGYLLIQLIGFINFFVKEHNYSILDQEDYLIWSMLILTIFAELLSPAASLYQLLKIQKLVKKREKNIELTLILVNIIIWILDTFSAKDSRTNPFMIRAYGKLWHTIDPIWIPLTIFFNFHASIILIKLKDGHYDE
jgi:hypothetical protein